MDTSGGYRSHQPGIYQEGPYYYGPSPDSASHSVDYYPVEGCPNAGVYWAANGGPYAQPSSAPFVPQALQSVAGPFDAFVYASQNLGAQSSGPALAGSTSHRERHIPPIINVERVVLPQASKQDPLEPQLANCLFQRRVKRSKGRVQTVGISIPSWKKRSRNSRHSWSLGEDSPDTPASCNTLPGFRPSESRSQYGTDLPAHMHAFGLRDPASFGRRVPVAHGDGSFGTDHAASQDSTGMHSEPCSPRTSFPPASQPFTAGPVYSSSTDWSRGSDVPWLGQPAEDLSNVDFGFTGEVDSHMYGVESAASTEEVFNPTSRQYTAASLDLREAKLRHEEQGLRYSASELNRQWQVLYAAQYRFLQASQQLGGPSVSPGMHSEPQGRSPNAPEDGGAGEMSGMRTPLTAAPDAYKASFERYNRSWPSAEQVRSGNSGIPWPTLTMKPDELAQRSLISPDGSVFSDADAMKWMAHLFFVRAFGLEPFVKKDNRSTCRTFSFTPGTGEQIRDLRAQARIELVRWHPDKLKCKYGLESDERTMAVYHAASSLYNICGEVLEEIGG